MFCSYCNGGPHNRNQCLADVKTCSNCTKLNKIKKVCYCGVSVSKHVQRILKTPRERRICAGNTRDLHIHLVGIRSAKLITRAFGAATSSTTCIVTSLLRLLFVALTINSSNFFDRRSNKLVVSCLSLRVHR